MEKEKKQDGGKLRLWQERLADSDTAYADEAGRMDDREQLYRGKRDLKPLVEADKNKSKKSNHIRNIIFENIESQISSSIPQPKVTPQRQEDEHLADIIEHFLRNELDRLPFEQMNDMAERTVPIQGGVGFLVEWDHTARGGGALDVTVVHPKQFGPQPGVYTGVDDMDWFILKMPTTKQAVRRRYGKSVYAEGESEPELRGTGSEDHSNDAVTVYIGYAVNEEGAIDKFVWVNDVVLEDLQDYQARRQPVCKQCGRMKPLPGQLISSAVHLPQQAHGVDPEGIRLFAQGLAGQMLGQQEPLGMGAPEQEPEGYDGGACPWCGCEEFTEAPTEFEEIEVPVLSPGGVSIPGAMPGVDEMGQPVMKPTKVPFYKPDCMPIVLQRSVSVFGQLLGNSDVDMIADQQNTVNRLEQKIIDRLLKAGSRIVLPKSLQMDPEDGERWYLDKPSEKEMIGLYEFKGNLQYELNYLHQAYEESRQILGITDSFQGRRDPTATSGVAKERSAAQAAGRMESKRVMKNAAYAKLFEVMFKFALAYSDEPKQVSFKNHKGQTEYQQFNRYDFLEQDENGNWVWNDRFLFSCDTAAPLASDRAAMWQETRMNLQTGAFGNPQATETLILFWDKMEQLHYPGAAATKKYLEDRLEQERQMQQQQAMAQQQAMTQQGGGMPMGG